MKNGQIIQEEYFNKVIQTTYVNYFLVIDGEKVACGNCDANDVPKRLEITGKINAYKAANNL